MKNLKNDITKIVMLGVIALLLAGFVPTAVLAEGTDGSETMSRTEMQDLINDASNGSTVKLEKDVVWTDTEQGDGSLVIPESKGFTLDLNGHTIDRGLAGKTAVEGGNVITVQGNLTLTDSSTGTTGKLTGGNTTGNGGGVYVAQNATFTMSGGTISGCTATGEYSKGGGVHVSGGTFTMNGGTISGCGATDGGGVYNAGTFNMSGGTIDSCNAKYDDLDGFGGGVYNAGCTFNMNGGTITNCSAEYDGGGVYNAGGTFNMSDGSTIVSCNAKKGGGVCVNNDGTFNMSGGTIDSCNTEAAGGGVCNYGEFTMEGGTISGCTSAAGGGVCNGGTFTMNGGTITGCGAAQGGGVCNDGTFTMEGGTISGCSATIDIRCGGGVYNDGTFNMSGGTISGCTSAAGGGVCNDGTFTMERGTISGCGAAQGGGVYNAATFTMSDGVYVKKGGMFNMSDGTISGCSANDEGGGVYVKNDSTFNMSGLPVIRDNKKDGNANNVVLDGGNTITVIGTLTDGAEILVNADKGVAFAKNGESYSITDTDLAKFHSDTDNSLVAAVDSDGSFKFFTPWGALQAKFYNASTVSGNPTLITLTDDITASGNESALVIPAGKYIILDLSGNTIDRGLAGKTAVEGGNVITVNGNLTLTDSSTDHTGKITGGNIDGDGGGVYVNGGGTFTMEGGKIDNCTATGESCKGGGVYNAGTFNMSGGTIDSCNATFVGSNEEIYGFGGGVYNAGGTFNMSDGSIIVSCKAEKYGGGVYNAGTFNMSGGTIDSCNAEYDDYYGNGGGVYNAGTFNMSGGTIDSCRARFDGGGVYNAGTFTMKNNGTISGCGAEKGGGVCVNNDGKFTMEGGTISGCEAYICGGVYNHGEFTMEGGTISDCSTDNQGGGVNSDGTFTMSGGKITNCIAKSYGGGVSNAGTFTMEDGTITGCKAEGLHPFGGGVYNDGTFNMNGGTISGCSANGEGGGVYNDGTFNMSDGTISDCSENYEGGGVYVYAGTFTMEGGTISGCTATNAGGGVYVKNDSTFNMSGAPVIRDNSANNVVLDGSNTITVIGTLTDGAVIYINANKGTTVAQIGAPRTDPLTETETGYFKSDINETFIGGLNDDGKLAIKAPLPELTGAGNLTYNGTEQTPALTFSGDPDPALTAGTDYTVSYKKVFGSTETVINGAPKDAGSYKAVVTGTGSYKGTYEASFTIAPKTVTVRSGISANNKTYDGTTAATLYSTEATVFDGICTGDILTVSGNGTFDSASAGSGKTVTIDLNSLTLGGTSSGNYVLASGGNQSETTATINKKKLTITGVIAADKEYDGNTTATTDTSKATVTGLVDGDNVEFTVSGSFEDANKGESKTVTLSGWTLTSGGKNYEIDAENSQPTAAAGIEQKEVGLTWSNTSLTFNGSVQAPTATATGTVNSDEIGVTVNGGQTNAGTGYTATASGLTGEKAGNYKLPEAKTANFSIGKAAAQTITDVASSQVYTLTGISASVAGKMPENAGTLTYTAGTATKTGDVTVSNFAVDNSGNVTANISGGAETDTITLPVTISSTNYADSAVNVMITLTPKEDAELGITGAPTSKTYGEDFTLTGSVKKEGIGTGNWTWTTSDATVFRITSNGAAATVKILKAGSATITARYESDTTVDTKTTDTITVNTKTLTIGAKDQSIYVGGTVPTLFGTDFYTVTGLVGTDKLTAQPTLAYQKDGSAATPDGNTAGTYDIVPSGAAASENYTISYTNGILTIREKGTQTISAENVTVTYGDTDKSVSANVTEPATGGGAISHAVKDGSADYIDVNTSTGALTIKKVPADGKAYVVVTVAETAAYEQATKEVTVTINKANTVPATVSANNCTYDGNEKLLVTVDESTLVGGEMWYALGENATTAPVDNLYTTSIPAKTDTGIYYVWYKVVADGNHIDTEPACVTVKIAQYIPPHYHSYTSTVTEEPTCTEDGERTYSCSCGASYKETIKATGHTIVAHEAKDATCGEDGNKAYWECSKCKKFFSDAEGKTEVEEKNIVIGKLAHKLTAHEEVKATCTEDGKKAYWECAECKKLFADAEGKKEVTEESLIIKALGHKLTAHEDVKATCTEDGKKAYWECSECKKLFADAEGKTEVKEEDLVIKAEGHKLTHFEAVEATTEKEGNIEYWICSVCGKYFADAEGKTEITEEKTILPKSKHKLTLVPEKKATCTEDGNTAYYTCADCDKLFEDAEGTKEITLEDTVIKAEGHKMTHVEAKEPTVEEEGNIEYWTCEVCGKFFADAEGKNEITEEETKTEKLKDIADCEISGLATQAYTGKAVTPVVTLKYDGKILKKGTDYTVTYANNTKAGTATVTIKGMGDYAGTITKKFLIKQVSLKYRAYVQKKNWMTWSTAKVSGTEASKMAGTTQDLRMETIQMQLSGVSGSVEYRAYCSKKGWTQWATTADTSTYAGTKGESRRVELIQLRAKGQVATLYDMYFRAYSEKLGWLNWAKSGEKAGTQGYGYKLEAFQVNFVKKGEAFKLASQNKMAKSFYDKTKDGADPK